MKISSILLMYLISPAFETIFCDEEPNPTAIDPKCLGTENGQLNATANQDEVEITRSVVEDTTTGKYY